MSLFHAGLQPALDANGNPISGATWSFYETGTTTPANVYSTSALNVSLGATVTANSAGRFAVVFLDDAVTYRATLKDAGGSTIKDIDPANGAVIADEVATSGGQSVETILSGIRRGRTEAEISAALADATVAVIELAGSTIAHTSGLTVSRSNLTIQGVPGKTKLTSATLSHGLLTFDSVSNIVIRDVIFELTLNSAVDAFGGIVETFHTDLTDITFERCEFTCPDLAANGVKFVFDSSATGGFRIRFYDCNVHDVGRMGYEFQNQGAGTTERYGQIVIRGGTVKNTGLVVASGQGVSFDGYSGDNYIWTTYDNTLLCCFEGVGICRSVIGGRAQNITRACDVISMTNTLTMTGNLIQDFRCVGEVNGGVTIRTQVGLHLADNYWDLNTFAEFTSCTATRSRNETYVCDGAYALFVQGIGLACSDNIWDSPTIDHSGAGGGAFGTIRFYGSNLNKDNQVRNPRITYAGSGAFFDNVSSGATLPKNNFVVGAYVDGSPQLTDTYTMAADADASVVTDGFDVQRLRGDSLTIASTPALTAPRTITLPEYLPKSFVVRNSTGGGQSLTISNGAGSTVSIANGVAKTLLVTSLGVVEA